MKLKDFKQVVYHGISLVVDSDVAFIATDEDGTTWGYSREPEVPDVEYGYWSARDGFNECFELPDMDLDGMDWTDTLMEVAA